MTSQFIVLTRVDRSGGRERTQVQAFMIRNIVAWRQPMDGRGFKPGSVIFTTAGVEFEVLETPEEIGARVEGLKP